MYQVTANEARQLKNPGPGSQAAVSTVGELPYFSEQQKQEIRARLSKNAALSGLAVAIDLCALRIMIADPLYREILRERHVRDTSNTTYLQTCMLEIIGFLPSSWFGMIDYWFSLGVDVREDASQMMVGVLSLMMEDTSDEAGEAIYSLTQAWMNLSDHNKRLCATRLLQRLRHTKSWVCELFEEFCGYYGLELVNVRDADNPTAPQNQCLEIAPTKPSFLYTVAGFLFGAFLMRKW